MSQFLENKKNPDQQYPEIMNVVGMPIIKQMVSYYEEQTERFLIDGAVHITDKMPFNFFHLGMISVIFPKATIIHCHRHPAATITSIYSQNFRIPQPFGSELESMGEYYQLYQDMMTYWESVLPINVYDVEYEDLVAHPKRVIMEMVEHCHLPWDEACLKYHENDNHVRTASIWQVRQPMYKSSLAKWKKFKKHLGPIKHLI